METRDSSACSFRLAALPLCLALYACGGGGTDPSPDEANAVPSTTSQDLEDVDKAVSVVSVWPSDSAASGTAILVKGERFTRDCAVQVFLNDPQEAMLGRWAVRSDGSFAAQTVIPMGTATGAHQLGAQGLSGADCDEPSTNVAVQPFQVTGSMPVIELDAIEGRPGGVTLVEGRGFCGDVDCSAVTVLADGSVAAAGIEVAEDGTFSAEARIPAVDNAGEIMVVAIQTDAEGHELRGFGGLTVTVRPDSQRPEVE